MTREENRVKLSRRRFLEAGSAVLAVTAGMRVAQGQEQNHASGHHLPNESQPVQNNTALDDQNPDLACDPAPRNWTT